MVWIFGALEYLLRLASSMWTLKVEGRLEHIEFSQHQVKQPPSVFLKSAKASKPSIFCKITRSVFLKSAKASKPSIFCKTTQSVFLTSVSSVIPSIPSFV